VTRPELLRQLTGTKPENIAACNYLLRILVPGWYGKVVIEIADGTLVQVDETVRRKPKDLLKFA
jgi:hypothetical protein